MKRTTFLFKIKGWVVVHPTCLHQGGRRHTSLWAHRGTAETTAILWGLLCFHLCKWEEKRHSLSPDETRLPCWQLLPHPHSWILANNAWHGAEAPGLAVFRHFYHVSQFLHHAWGTIDKAREKRFHQQVGVGWIQPPCHPTTGHLRFDLARWGGIDRNTGQQAENTLKSVQQWHK